MKNTLYFEDFLNNYLNEKKASNKRYSLRLMAKKIGLEPSLFSKILRKKYRLNDGMIQRIGQSLELNSDVIKEYCILNKKLIDQQEFAEMDIDLVSKLSHWESLVVLRSFDMNSSFTAQNLAKRLGSSLEKIEGILDFFIKNKLIKKNKQGQYERLKDQYMVKNSNQKSMINRELTKEMILKAHESVDKNAVEERIHVNAVSSVSKETYKIMQNKIHKLILELSRLSAEDKGKEDSIMVFNVNFFPVMNK